MSIIDIARNSITYNSKENNTMDITIYDLIESEVDKLITQDSDIYGRSIRPGQSMESPFPEDRVSHTVDLLFNVTAVAVDDHHLIMEFPNGNILAVPLDSYNYHKIEVM